jgi:hypothetical protein
MGKEVRSSIALHIDGLVEMMLDATLNHTAPLTAERLFGWHATLFPTGRTGITVGACRPAEAGPMRVVEPADTDPKSRRRPQHQLAGLQSSEALMEHLPRPFSGN